jgi:hypothetical protein
MCGQPRPARPAGAGQAGRDGVSGGSAHEPFDRRDKLGRVLEQEGVSRVGIKKQERAGNAASEQPVVRYRVELVKRPVRDQRARLDPAQLAAGRVTTFVA